MTSSFNSNYEYNSDKNNVFMDLLEIERLFGNILGKRMQNSKKFGSNTIIMEEKRTE